MFDNEVTALDKQSRRPPATDNYLGIELELSRAGDSRSGVFLVALSVQHVRSIDLAYHASVDWYTSIPRFA